MKYKNILTVGISLVCAIKVLADCNWPTDFDAEGSCGGTAVTAAYPACKNVTYLPNARNECEPASDGFTPCVNTIVIVRETTEQMTSVTLYGYNVCIYPSTITTVDTDSHCVRGIPGANPVYCH